jgi:hypothetical protein
MIDWRSCALKAAQPRGQSFFSSPRTHNQHRYYPTALSTSLAVLDFPQPHQGKCYFPKILCYLQYMAVNVHMDRNDDEILEPSLWLPQCTVFLHFTVKPKCSRLLFVFHCSFTSKSYSVCFIERPAVKSHCFQASPLKELYGRLLEPNETTARCSDHSEGYVTQTSVIGMAG